MKNTVTETCTTCHAEKRGPFLWEHQPVNEDCTNCHTPHGSNITPLLKSRPPFLCDECHDGPHNSQAPYGTAVAGIQGGGALAGRQSELECGGARVHELPRDDSRFEFAGRCVPPSLIRSMGVAMKTDRTSLAASAHCAGRAERVGPWVRAADRRARAGG